MATKSGRQPSLLESGPIGSFFSSLFGIPMTKSEAPVEKEAKNERLLSIAVDLTLNVALGIATLYLSRAIFNRFVAPQLHDDDRPAASSVYRNLARILQKRGQTTLPVLDSYELQMAEVILDPDTIETSFADVGGLDDTKKEIYELAVLPLVHPELFSTSKLVQPCKGILLYGKPGTGKTMMAKALAKESSAVFLPLQLSKILNKYVGESNKLIAATFRLAHKLQPAIIFIDELDTFLKANSGEASQYLDTIKSEFLTLWDGVSTNSTTRVLVLGATNQPHSIDPAIQRRMPRTFYVPLPNEVGRRAILDLLLQGEALEAEAKAFVPELAQATAGYSGSDLKELCKAAAMVGVQERSSEYARRRVMGEQGEVALDKESKLRPISRRDLETAFRKVGRTGAAANAYGRAVSAEQQRDAVGVDSESLRNLTRFLRTLSTLSEAKTDSEDIPNL